MFRILRWLNNFFTNVIKVKLKCGNLVIIIINKSFLFKNEKEKET